MLCRTDLSFPGGRGFTLIELAVCLGVLALLASLLLPAILYAREASRRAECEGHLHQIGVAISHFEGVERSFPTRYRGGFSMWPVLPYVDQAPLYAQLTSDSPPSSLPLLDVFLCPSDPVAADYPGDINYFYNQGTRFRNERDHNGFSRGRGRSTTAREFRDGLSNTAAMAERLVATRAYYPHLSSLPDEELRRDTRRYLWYTSSRVAQPGKELDAADLCRTSLVTPLPFTFGPMGQGYRPNTGYDHLLSPNQTACYNDTPGGGANSSVNATLIPPSSEHSGGVNVLMADGRVAFVSDSIDDAVWRAIATRDGGESESLR